MRDAGLFLTDAAESGPAFARRGDRTSDLGTNAHIRLTLGRVSHLLADSRIRRERSQALQSRTEEVLTTSHRAVRESEALRAALRLTLRASVTAYVRRLHDEQVPPERMLVLVKDAVRAATPASADVLEGRELMESVVRWSIEAYYAA